MSLIVNKICFYKTRTVYLLTVFLLLFLNLGINASTQLSEDEYIKTEDSLKTANLNQKAKLLSKLLLNYEKTDKQKQLKYASELASMPDSIVSAKTKLEALKILNDYYQNKSLQNDKKVLETNKSSIPLIVFVFSIILLVVAILFYLLTKKKYDKQLGELEQKAEDIYNEKYNKIQELEGKIKEELKPLNEEYEKLHGEEKELKKRLKGLEEANYLKNAFLSNMSHQIRSSLNGISGFASMLETELAMMGDQNLYSYAQKIQQSGSKLENLLTNIIDISTIEANVAEKQIEQIKVDDVIKNVEEINIFKANEKGLVFKTKIEKGTPLVLADRKKLTKLLNVLVDNAIKYTSKGFVTVLADYLEDENKISFEVKDTGQGFETEYANVIDKVFKSEIVDENEISYQGIGIGLKLCKRYTDLMKGSISITTKPGNGSSFKIILPAGIEEISDSEVSKTEEIVTLMNAPQLGSLDIFIVEDDRMNRMVLEKMLKKSGSITTAVDGDDALSIIKKRSKKGQAYHVMLFDINLPAPWDGIRLMREIKRLYPEYKKIPFIAQTAYAMAGDKDRFLDEGFDDYIAKPIMKNKLLTLIEKQINKFASIS